MKTLLQKILKILAKAILAKYRPEIIGITGSVGKTSAKEAIYRVLASAKFKVRQNINNYNNEIGLPLTIIGAASPLNSPLGWLKVLFLAVNLLLKNDRTYPKILVLEMAADKPGDLNYLTDIAHCDIAVITSIGDSHLEFFKTLDNLKIEKATLIRKLSKSGWAVLNIDDDNVKATIKETEARVFTYGINNEVDLGGREIRIKFSSAEKEKDGFGLTFKLIRGGSFAPVFLPDIISHSGVYAALAGAAVGIIKGLNLVDISRALKKLSSPKGRMKVLAGIKNTFIIDDTYNSSPLSSVSALAALGGLTVSDQTYKYAILGDMQELGAASVAGHEAVGRAVVKNKVNILIVVGERSRDIARGAKAAGMKPDNIFHFAAPEEAGKFVKERIKTGDIVLVKGSQAMRLEKIVKEIMAEPLRASELLVRQGREWEK
ncbi:hypothetical protein A3H66_02535 [Candidatus Falkowbacteria bacterium RIFCSPLOWO2_02_FULL_45_21]|uniref:UDP-N-acetylmuramoyl-tripeptide--D-alanyl-D-alanine ligase n=1 Tax=Candidatus Falkowbacteria bacterium RIFCSPLOWO2_02_FULL_45_21 TaxID=1797989 RepID=A0A1F5SB95_9BACT|nr:MAG: hypothetical protein A3H66_02535 [Candidatus Falkowbacteria bacterium RIFCSPLOWO2_02_FULL_45_21]